MSQTPSSISGVDAAAPHAIPQPLSLSLLRFARDCTRYAASPTETLARTLLCSPFSGVPGVDASLICAVAGDRGTIGDALERQRVALGSRAAHAAARFGRALETLVRAFRVPGATATEHVTTIAQGFGLDSGLTDVERTTLAHVATLASHVDDSSTARPCWDDAEFCDALDRLARASPPAVRPLPSGTTALRPPETRRPITRKKTHFSASSLNLFAQCERRWFYRYVCTAIEDRSTAASVYGSAFHWALERFHEEFPRGDRHPAEELAHALDAYIGTAFERFRAGFPTAVEFELQRRRARRTARHYLRWFVERARTRPFTVAAIEESVELELDGHSFIGYIDRLDRDDATAAVTIVDYKTGSIVESANEYREKVAAATEFQLPFYYWARVAAGDRVTRLSLVPLKDDSRPVVPIELEVVPVAAPRGYDAAPQGTIGIDELDRARRTMVEIASKLADAPIESFAPTDDPGQCGYCPYVVACRDRPLPREDRFGR